jgi:hypothetical protein
VDGMGGWVDGWMGGWVDGWMSTAPVSPRFWPTVPVRLSACAAASLTRGHFFACDIVCVTKKIVEGAHLRRPAPCRCKEDARHRLTQRRHGLFCQCPCAPSARPVGAGHGGGGRRRTVGGRLKLVEFQHDRTATDAADGRRASRRQVRANTVVALRGGRGLAPPPRPGSSRATPSNSCPRPWPARLPAHLSRSQRLAPVSRSTAAGSRRYTWQPYAGSGAEATRDRRSAPG